MYRSRIPSSFPSKLLYTAAMLVAVLVLMVGCTSQTPELVATAEPTTPASPRVEATAQLTKPTPLPTTEPPATALTNCERAFEEAAAISDLQDTVEDLDPALEACTTIEEWKAASRKFPDALDGVDSLVFLENRCRYTEGAKGPICDVAGGNDNNQVSNRNEFDDGTYLVGTDIAPGLYEAAGGGFCYWARLKGFSGSLDDIIANGGLTNGRQLVAVAPTDSGFEASGCSPWKAYVETAAPFTTIPDGMWVVGVEMPADTYSAPGGEFCYWARLRGFGGELEDIIVNSLGAGRQIATISSSDIGFHTEGCGDWTRSG